MEHLFDKLGSYGESDMYPLHMPGHKRNAWGNLPAEIYKKDITEIDGFDNLHQAEEILAELQTEASRLYDAEETFYLVNGSTCGVLAAISAAVKSGGNILMARNCHKSAYHAAYLRQLHISYLFPNFMDEYDVYDAITSEQVERALAENNKIEAVLVVSPTYEGRIADIKAIAEVVHRYGIPLIVDEAHGAHLGLSKMVSKNSCQLGADLVIHSVHKTLPAMTQTALLHVNGELVDRDKLRRFLHIYQSSSPSYVLMASIDNALDGVKNWGETAYHDFVENFYEMCDRLSHCKNIKIIPSEKKTQDVGKLLISTKNTNISGNELYRILVERYHLQPEMAGESFVLAMFTINDTKEGYERTMNALLEIDRQISKAENGDKAYLPIFEEKRDILNVIKYSLFDAWDRAVTMAPLATAEGKTAGEFVNLYPPGVPILVPGEVISKDIIEKIYRWEKLNLNVQGIVRCRTDNSNSQGQSELLEEMLIGIIEE